MAFVMAIAALLSKRSKGGIGLRDFRWRCPRRRWHKRAMATQDEPAAIRTAEDAAALFGPRLASGTRERLLVAHLDGESRLLELVEADEGGDVDVALPLRAIVADALRLGSAGLVLGHSHPSGNPEPSEADLEATRRLAQILAWLDIRLHDHLIFACREWRSLRMLGLL
jgi:DNA repair protein RadC